MLSSRLYRGKKCDRAQTSWGKQRLDINFISLSRKHKLGHELPKWADRVVPCDKPLWDLGWRRGLLEGQASAFQVNGIHCHHFSPLKEIVGSLSWALWSWEHRAEATDSCSSLIITLAQSSLYKDTWWKNKYNTSHEIYYPWKKCLVYHEHFSKFCQKKFSSNKNFYKIGRSCKM